MPPTCLVSSIPDEKLEFLPCCYEKYEGVRNVNKYFKRIMHQTRVNGDSFCNCVYYDARITMKVTNPTKEFFDSI